MYRNKRIWSLVVAMVLALSLVVVSGCSKSENKEQGQDNAAKTEQSADKKDGDNKKEEPKVDAEQPGSITVTDAAGRTVTIKQPVERVSARFGIEYVLQFGMEDKLVSGTKRSDFYDIVAPNVSKLPDIYKDGEISVEAVAALEPDVFIHRANAKDVFEQLDKVGVPAIGLRTENVDEIKDTIKLLGEVFGKQDRAKELTDLYTRYMDTAAELVKDVPESERPTAIMMSRELGKVAHGGMLQSVMMNTAGAVNLAEDVEAPGKGTWPAVGVEQIFEWNPDFIFTQNSNKSDYTIDELKADPTWGALKAFQNDHVYRVPSELDSWEFPGLQSSLGTLWMVSVMYPDKLPPEEFDKYIQEFYQVAYGVDMDREKLKMN